MYVHTIQLRHSNITVCTQKSTRYLSAFSAARGLHKSALDGEQALHVTALFSVKCCLLTHDRKEK